MRISFEDKKRLEEYKVSFSRRSLAVFIDAIIFSLIATLINSVDLLENLKITHSHYFPLILFFLYINLFNFMPWRATPGKVILNIKVISFKGDTPSYKQLFIRSIIQILSLLILFNNLFYISKILKFFGCSSFACASSIGLFSFFLNFLLIYLPVVLIKRHLTLHDLLSKTFFVYNKPFLVKE
jgi:uncharacterized RDD family membrane protein YckC